MTHLMIALLFCLFGNVAFSEAETHVAWITRANGDVKIFVDQGARPKGDGPSAIVGGKRYKVQAAKPGTKIYNGQIIQTGDGAACRLIFKNGDAVTISEGSQYRMRWDVSKADKPILDLLYGKIRSQILKGGPRSNLEVRARTMTLGVRGTDFFVADPSLEGDGKLTVIRGSVDVKPAGSDAQPVTIPAGSTADVKTAPSSAPKDVKELKVDVAVRKTTKAELTTLSEATTLPAAALAVDQGAADAIAKLEQSATQNVLTDIKKSDPELYARISDKKGLGVQDINSLVVEKAVSAAPEDSVAAEQEERSSEPEKKTQPEPDQGKRPIRVQVALGGGSYNYDYSLQSVKHNKSGGIGGSYLGVDWDPSSVWHVAARIGSLAVNELTQAKEEKLDYSEILGVYRQPLGIVRADFRLVLRDDSFPVVDVDPLNKLQARSVSTQQVLVGLGASHMFSPGRDLMAGVDYAIRSDAQKNRVHRNETTGFYVAFRHHPFGGRWTMKYLYESVSRKIEFSQEPNIHHAQVKFKRAQFLIGPGYSF